MLGNSNGLRFRGGFDVPVLRGVAILVLLNLAGGCGGDGTQPPPAGGGTGNTPTTTSRLAWSQGAPSLATAQGYRFVLFIDGARNSLTSVSCTGGSSPYECISALPSIAPGRHVLELAAIDPATGLESAKSAPLVIGAANLTGPAGVTPESTVRLSDPNVTCVAGDASLCFTASLLADNLEGVHLLRALPDGRLLALHESGDLTFLPSQISEPTDLGRRGETIEVADVAVDPDFHENRFLYFATVATDPASGRRISVVRVRELADRIGEAATIVADLPASPDGSPAISVGPDGQLYVAMPGVPGATAMARPYDSLVLRFTRDGAAAGHAGSASPILSRGSARPTSLMWDSRSRLVLGSDEPSEPALALVRVSSEGGAWPAPAIAVKGVDVDGVRGGVHGAAVNTLLGIGTPTSTLFLLGAEPPAAYVASLGSEEAAELTSVRALPLGTLAPEALTVASTGDLIVAVRIGDTERVRLLRLRVR